MTVRRRLLALLAVALVVTMLVLSVPQSQRALEPFLDAETWRTWRELIRGYGALAPLASIALSVIQIIPLPIPPPAIPLANGWLFGAIGGTLVSWTGVMINGLLGYLLARGPGRRLLLRLVTPAQLAQAESALDRYGASAVAIMRMIPIIPFSAISVAAGLLHMDLRAYVAANALGILPSAYAMALIGSQLSRGALDWAQVALAVSILAGLALAGIPLSHRLNG